MDLFSVPHITFQLLAYSLEVERVAYMNLVDVIPGSVSAPLVYAVVARLCKHWQYFLHSDVAIPIINL